MSLLVDIVAHACKRGPTEYAVRDGSCGRQVMP